MKVPPPTQTPADAPDPAAADAATPLRTPRRLRVSRASVLVLTGYLLAALALTARIWANPSGLEQAGNPHDIDLFTWFIGYEAAALRHGGLPALVTTALNAPQGVNLMWNTSLLLPGVLLAPVTWLAGPLVTLTTVLTLGFAGSAASLCWVLRRWGASLPAAAVAGAVYGFSPALLGAAMGHYHLQFAVLPPLIIDALLRVAAGRGTPVRNGAYLGAVVSAQIFTGEELLAITAITGAVVLALLAAARPQLTAARARGAAIALVTATAVIAVVCGHALWVQFTGPLTEYGSPWHPWNYRAHLPVFVTPPGSLLLHTRASAAFAARYPAGPPEYLSYLGWPLLIVLAAAAVRYWRATPVRVAALTWALLEIFSLGSAGFTAFGFHYPMDWTPWYWLARLPVAGQILPGRFAITADGAAAAALAFAFDRARQSQPAVAGWARRALPAAALTMALLPLVPLPLRAQPVPAPPPGWQAVFARLHLAPGARTLVIPVGVIAMRWQADSQEPVSLIGGRCIAPGPGGKARPCLTGRRRGALYLGALWRGSHRRLLAPALFRADLRYWRPAAVVTQTKPGSELMLELTRIFGPPTVRSGHVAGWYIAGRFGP